MDLFNIMSGRDLPYLDQEAQVFIWPLPWMTLGIVLIIATALVVFATRLNERRDF